MILPASARVRAAFAVVLACSAAGVAGAANLHRAVTTPPAGGSGGATAFLQGTTTGSALQGEVASSANTSIKIPFGLLGEYDASTSTFGSGVLGISTSGYAVGAESLSSQPSMLALAGGTGIAFEAVTPSGTATSPAIYAESHSYGAAIEGVTDSSSGLASVVAKHDNAGANADYVDGVYAEATNGRAAIESVASGGTEAAGLAENTSSGTPTSKDQYIGSYSYSVNGTGAYVYSGGSQAGYFFADGANASGVGIETQAVGTSGVGVSASGTAVGVETETGLTTSAYPKEGIVGTGQTYGLLGITTGGTATYPLYLASTSGEIAYVDATGALYLHNGVHTFAQTRGGYGVESYTPRSSTPTVEDTGEGRLSGGSAVVTLDPAVSQSLDRSASYHVFLTPEADTNGLYVAQKTPGYFVVRETRGGRGSFSFDYRIVGAVDGEANARMVLTSKRRMDDGQPVVVRAASHAAAAHKLLHPNAHRAFSTFAAPPLHPLMDARASAR